MDHVKREESYQKVNFLLIFRKRFVIYGIINRIYIVLPGTDFQIQSYFFLTVKIAHFHEVEVQIGHS